jgi:hypothetical protein
MGNAFTAVANDEMTLYYNPAGLRSVRYNMYELVTGSVTTNENVLDIADTATTGDNSEIEYELSRITGEKLYGELVIGGLSLVTPRWGLSVSNKSLLDIQLSNPVVPYLDVLAYTQTGLIGGVAWSYWDYQLDVGVNLKAINRTGVDREFRLFDEAILDAVNNNDTSKLEEEFSSKTLLSPDLGVTYHMDDLHNLYPKFSIVLQNIGGMDFDKAGELPMQVNVGMATESEVIGLDLTLAADYYDLLNAQDLNPEGQFYTARNLSFGAELGWEKLYNGHHAFAFRLGFDGPYLAYGASFNLFGLKFDYASWGEEIGEYAGATKDQRTMLQASLIF